MFTLELQIQSFQRYYKMITKPQSEITYLPTDKGLISITYNELVQINKKWENPIEKQGKNTWVSISSKRVQKANKPL